MTGNVKKGGGMFDAFSKYIPIKKVNELIETIEDPDSGKDTIVTVRGVSKKHVGTPEYYPQYMVGDSEFSQSYWGVRVTDGGKYYLKFHRDKIDLKTNNEAEALEKDIKQHNIRMTKHSKSKYEEVMNKKNASQSAPQSAGKKRRTKKRKSMKKKQRKTKRRKSLKKRKSIKKRKA